MSYDNNFATMSFGSAGPIPAPQETINVVIDPTLMVDDYAVAFVREAQRKAPLKFERQPITPDEISSYARFLLKQRVLSVRNDCSLYRQLKVLYIPSYLQYAISMIGEVNLRAKGIRLMPVYEEEVISIDQAKEISEKISAFTEELQIVRDAMPRDAAGDVDTMSTALIAGYAMSIEKVEHEASAYVAAFLGFKLQEELAFKVLYRTQYDDIGYITSAVMSRRELF